jgi:hypothetical protein
MERRSPKHARGLQEHGNKAPGTRGRMDDSNFIQIYHLFDRRSLNLNKLEKLTRRNLSWKKQRWFKSMREKQSDEGQSEYLGFWGGAEVVYASTAD